MNQHEDYQPIEQPQTLKPPTDPPKVRNMHKSLQNFTSSPTASSSSVAWSSSSLASSSSELPVLATASSSSWSSSSTSWSPSAPLPGPSSEEIEPLLVPSSENSSYFGGFAMADPQRGFLSPPGGEEGGRRKEDERLGDGGEIPWDRTNQVGASLFANYDEEGSLV